MPLSDPTSLLSVLLQNAAEAIYFKDRESRFICVSRTLVRTLGCNVVEQVIGRTDADFFGQKHAEQALADEQEIMRTGAPLLNVEEREDFPDGSVRWAHTCKYPFFNSRGEIVGTFGVSRDVTALHEAKERLQKTTDLLAKAGRIARLGHWQVDASGDFVFWSDITYELHGIEPGTPVTFAASINFYHPLDRQRIKSAFDLAMHQGVAFDQEARLLREDGEFVWVRVKCESLYDCSGGARRVTGILLDIDALKRTEELLKERNLALEIATNRAEQLTREAQQAALAKAEFLASMSHEIRTPLNAIIGMSELLLDTPLSSQQRDFAATVRTSSDALLGLLNDILDFSKIESGQMELEKAPVHLRDCVEGALDIAARPAGKKGVELLCRLSPDLPDLVVGDITRLRQIFINLVGNAVKFTEKGEVLVACTPRINAAGILCLHASVRDTGIGISSDGINRLFKSYSQAEASTARKYGGTGLGLAICQRLVGLMGGRIWVDSVIGQGSDFQFEIPLVPVGNATSQGKRIPKLEGRRILIVEDNATHRQILAQEVQNWGGIPLLAGSATEALTLLAQEATPEAAVIDLQLQGMDGRALITELRRTFTATSLPIVALTLLGPGGQSPDCLGVTRLISKPVKLGVLRESLINLFIPQSQPVLEAPQQAAVKQGQNFPLRILLAEDLEVNQQVVTFMLERIGYTCDVVADGRAAEAAVQTGRYDVVFMDMQMPVMDGLEATTRICEQHETKRRPWIIAMTANALNGDRESCLAAGMDDYLSKPVSMQPLAQSLTQAWAHLKLRRGSPTA
jgi:PAS domain S-box-containing protein